MNDVKENEYIKQSFHIYSQNTNNPGQGKKRATQLISELKCYLAGMVRLNAADKSSNTTRCMDVVL
jgi:hypothetical protein